MTQDDIFQDTPSHYTWLAGRVAWRLAPFIQQVSPESLSWPVTQPGERAPALIQIRDASIDFDMASQHRKTVENMTGKICPYRLRSFSHVSDALSINPTRTRYPKERIMGYRSQIITKM